MDLRRARARAPFVVGLLFALPWVPVESASSLSLPAVPAETSDKVEQVCDGPNSRSLVLQVLARTAEPVAGAAVSVVGSDLKSTTNAEGLVCFPREDDSELASARVVVTAQGFSIASRALDPKALARSSNEPLVISLEPAFGEAIVVSATRSAKRLLDVPVHIQQIDRDAMDAQAARTLAEAVEYTSGLRVESNCQNCNTSQLRMLGLEGPYSQILVDGQPTVSSLAMVYGLEQIPQRLLDENRGGQGRWQRSLRSQRRGRHG